MDEEANGETLSLADLPRDSCVGAEWEGIFSDYEFEFAISKWITTTTTAAANYKADSIDYFGKLIPIKQPVPEPTAGRGNSVIDTNKKQINGGSSSKPSLPFRFGRMTIPFYKTNNGGGGALNNHAKKYNLSVSIYSGSTLKLRRHMLMFGLSTRVPMEMNLSDIRNRQSRRIPPAMFPSNTGGGSGDGCDGDKKLTMRRIKKESLWDPI